MKLALSTWNSLNINDGSPFLSTIPRGQLANLILNPVLTPRADDYPALTNAVKQGSVLAIEVRAAAGQDINTARENVKKYFFADNDTHTLVALDNADSDKPYYRKGKAVGLTEGAPNTWIVRIQTEYPYWQLVTAATDSWSITATGQTRSITNGGNLPVRPVYTLTPTSLKTAGYKYQRYVAVYNPMDKIFNAPLELTNSAALNIPWYEAGQSNQVNEAGNIDASVTTWHIDTAVGGGLPATGGMFLIGTEQCSYTSISAGVISGVTRGIAGTTAASHADNTVMYYTVSRADKNDVRVFMDGVEIDRWVAHTAGSPPQIWVNISLAPLLQSSLLAGINNSVQTITFPQTGPGLAFLKDLKAAANTALLIENEVVIFSPANIDLINYQITSVLRGQKGTSAASHSAAVAVTYLEHDLFVVYGDASATAPETNDDNKPMFAVEDYTSQNTSWNWPTAYFEADANRPGAWKPTVASKSKLSYCYTADENTFADPASVLGMAERTSRDFTTPHETATVAWSISHPCGWIDIGFDTKKYRTGSWPGVVGIQVLQENVAWFGVLSEDAPSLAYTWEELTGQFLDLGGTYQSVRFVIDGTLSSTIDEAALYQASQVYMSPDDANLPVFVYGAQESANYMDFKLTNNTTGLWIKVKYLVPLNKTLTIDTDTKTAYLYDGRVVPVTVSTDRAEWLNLSAGANTLQFDDTGTAGITLATSHRDKVL